MCLIAYRPHGASNIPKDVVSTALNRHPDGFGLMWRDASGLHTQSFAPNQRKRYRKALAELDRSKTEYAAHFRWATSGPRNTEMAHPYVYNDPDASVGQVAVMHNGVISIQHDHAKESDTNAFVRLVLAALPSRWWTVPALVYLVNEAIGYSKFVIMTKDETVNLHDKRGSWDGGIWYSSDHKPAPPVIRTVGSSQYGSWDNGTQRWVPAPSNGQGYVVGASGTAYGATSGKGATPDAGTQRALTVVPPATGGKSAVASAAALGLIAPTTSVIRSVDEPLGFRHGGHNLTAIKSIDLTGADLDYEDSVICDTCETVGTVYVVDGQALIDMAHMSGPDVGDEDYQLLGEPMSGWAKGAH